MSETSTLFQAGTAAPASLPESEPDNPGNRSRLVLGGVLAGVVVLAVLAYFLFFSGGGATEPEVVPPAATAVEPAAPVEPAVEVPVQNPPASAKTFGRDPFKPRIVAADAAATATTAGTTTAPPAVVAPAAPVPVTGTTDGTTTTGGSVSSAPVAPVVTADHTFRVVNVAPNNATVTVNVDGKVYSDLAAGQVFATYFKVVVIGGEVNGFQFGDERFSVFGTKKLHIAA